MPGTAMVALYPMRLYIYIGSHKITGDDKFEPTDVMVPAGCAILLSNVANAGRGVWAGSIGHGSDGNGYDQLAPNVTLPSGSVE